MVIFGIIFWYGIPTNSGPNKEMGGGTLQFKGNNNVFTTIRLLLKGGGTLQFKGNNNIRNLNWLAITGGGTLQFKGDNNSTIG
jgi:hypothetical protein